MEGLGNLGLYSSETIWVFYPLLGGVQDDEQAEAAQRPSKTAAHLSEQLFESCVWHLKNHVSFNGIVLMHKIKHVCNCFHNHRLKLSSARAGQFDP